MKKYNLNNTQHLLSGIAIIAILFVLISELLSERQKHLRYENMADAAIQYYRSFKINESYRDSLGLGINPSLDPYFSGYIGVEFSLITSTVGNLEAKQCATNPDFAALITRWLNELHLTDSGSVVIHASASFPSLTVAAIIACENFGLQPLIMSSAGASSFGANIPEYCYWDMETQLAAQGILQHRSSYCSPGAQNDNASSLWEGGLQAIQHAAIRNGHELHTAKNLKEAINQKLIFIEESGPVEAFINIGGNQAALGCGPGSRRIPYGIIHPDQLEFFLSKSPDDTLGLIPRILAQNIPVIHLLHIRDIALENGLPLTLPIPWTAGQADCYYIDSHSKGYAIVILIILWILLIIYAKKIRRITRFRNT